jgi:predicted nucleotidyltransferase
MFEKVLEKIALALDEGRIRYMIIGGQAVLLHGEPRLTRDIDITLGVTVEKLDVVLKLAKGIGLKPLVDPETFTRKTMVLPCEDPQTGIRVDFIFSFSPYGQQAIERSLSVKMGRSRVKFASPEDLIVHKIFTGRPRDLEDVKSVLIKNPKIDFNYIRNWLKEFENVTEEPLLVRFNTIVKESGTTSP